MKKLFFLNRKEKAEEMELEGPQKLELEKQETEETKKPEITLDDVIEKFSLTQEISRLKFLPNCDANSLEIIEEISNELSIRYSARVQYKRGEKILQLIIKSGKTRVSAKQVTDFEWFVNTFQKM